MSIELPRLQDSFAALAAAADYVIVEGAGGWFAPLNEQQFVADLAAALALPVLLVVGLRLGCLNHALLTVAAIRQRGVPLAGWIANQIDPDFARMADNISTLERHIGVPPMAIVAHAPGAPASLRLPATATAALAQAAIRKQLT